MAFCTGCGSAVQGRFCVKCGKPVDSGVSPVPSTGGGSPVLQPNTVQPRKKTSPLVWVLVIVVGLFVLGAIGIGAAGFFVAHKAKQAGLDPELMQKNPALAASKFLASVNPDLKVIRVDEDSGLITIQDKTTGKTVTVDFDAIQKGKISFQEDDKPPMTMEVQGEGESGMLQLSSEEGTVKFGAGASAKTPSWVPTYPGASVQGNFSVQGNEGDGGSYRFSTKDSAKNVVAFYEKSLKGSGFRITSSSVHDGENAGGLLAAEDPDSKRNVLVTIGAEEGETSVNVVFGAKK